MGAEHDTILQQALSLPLEDRASLIQHLIASLDGGPEEGVEAAWATEIERRARRVLTGESQGQPWEDVRRRLESGLRRDG